MRKSHRQVVASWLALRKKQSSTAKVAPNQPLDAFGVCHNTTKSGVGSKLLTTSQVIQLKHLEETLQVTLQGIKSLLVTSTRTIDKDVALTPEPRTPEYMDAIDSFFKSDGDESPSPAACSSPLGTDRFSEDATIVQDDIGSDNEGVWSYLATLAELVSFCKMLWAAYGKNQEHVHTTCVITNLAIREMQNLHADFVSDHPHLETAEAIHRHLGVDIKSKEGQRSQWRIIAPESDLRNRALPDLLNPTCFTVLNMWKENASFVCGSQGRFAQTLHPVHDRITLALSSVYRMTKAGISIHQQDCLIDGIIELMEKSSIPTWLPSALAAYTEVFDRFATSSGMLWTIQERLLAHQIFNIENLVDRGERLTSVRHLERVAETCQNLLKARTKAVTFHASLQRFPVGACSIGFQIRLDAYLGALRYCKERSHLSIVARVYGTCMRHNLLNTSWNDLEYILDQHRDDTTCPVRSAFALHSCSNITAESALSSAEVTRGCTHNNFNLRPPKILAGIFDVSRSDPVLGFWQLCREEAKRHANDHSTKRMPIVNGLEQLFCSLREQEQELCFDYLTMAYNCEMIVSAMQRAYGFKTADEIESALLAHEYYSYHFMVEPELNPLLEAARIMNDFITRSGSEVLAASGQVLVELRQAERERCQDILRSETKSVRSEQDADALGLASPWGGRRGTFGKLMMRP